MDDGLWPGPPTPATAEAGTTEGKEGNKEGVGGCYVDAIDAPRNA
jgi:hypothetical protein